MVVETVGIPATQLQALELVRPRGRVVYVGTPHKNVEFTPEQFEKILRKEISITGSWMSSSAPFPGKAWNLSTRFLAEKRIRADILISHRFNICQIRKAFEVMADSSVFSEKVMILF